MDLLHYLSKRPAVVNEGSIRTLLVHERRSSAMRLRCLSARARPPSTPTPPSSRFVA